jgi:hypothetical protein
LSSCSTAVSFKKGSAPWSWWKTNNALLTVTQNPVLMGTSQKYESLTDGIILKWMLRKKVEASLVGIYCLSIKEGYPINQSKSANFVLMYKI